MKNTNKEDEIQYNQLALTVNESNRNLSISKQNLRTRNNDVFENTINDVLNKRQNFLAQKIAKGQIELPNDHQNINSLNKKWSDEQMKSSIKHELNLMHVNNFMIMKKEIDMDERLGPLITERTKKIVNSSIQK